MVGPISRRSRRAVSGFSGQLQVKPTDKRSACEVSTSPNHAIGSQASVSSVCRMSSVAISASAAASRSACDSVAPRTSPPGLLLVKQQRRLARLAALGHAGSGVGDRFERFQPVVFSLAHAVRRRLHDKPKPRHSILDRDDLLDLLGILGDHDRHTGVVQHLGDPVRFGIGPAAAQPRRQATARPASRHRGAAGCRRSPRVCRRGRSRARPVRRRSATPARRSRTSSAPARCRRASRAARDGRRNSAALRCSSRGRVVAAFMRPPAGRRCRDRRGSRRDCAAHPPACPRRSCVPRSSTVTRSEMSITTAMSCSIRMIVVPHCAFTSRMKRAMSSFSPWFMPPIGSSSSSTFGSSASARPSSTRLRRPVGQRGGWLLADVLQFEKVDQFLDAGAMCQVLPSARGPSR